MGISEQLLTVQSIHLPYDPVILLLGIYPKELKTYTKIYARMFMVSPNSAIQLKVEKMNELLVHMTKAFIIS